MNLCGKKNREKKTTEKRKKRGREKHIIKQFLYANMILFEQQSKATKAKHHEEQQM